MTDDAVGMIAPVPLVHERLTPDNTVLILVDYLTDLMLACRSIDGTLLRGNAVALARLGAVLDIPTILLGDEGTLNGPFMPEIKEAAHPSTRLIPRSTPSAMDEPAFVEALSSLRRRNLVMAGITTDNCVALTALDAVRAGYRVHVVVDASACFSTAVEDVALLRLVQAGIAPLTWVALGSELGRNWADPRSHGVLALYRERSGELANLLNNLAYYAPEKAKRGGK